jgi:hypothetical protein
VIAVTEIKQKQSEAGYKAHEREIVRLAVVLAFTLAYPHNKAHVLVGSEELIVEVATRAGFSSSFSTVLENYSENVK